MKVGHIQLRKPGVAAFDRRNDCGGVAATISLDVVKQVT